MSVGICSSIYAGHLFPPVRSAFRLVLPALSDLQKRAGHGGERLHVLRPGLVCPTRSHFPSQAEDQGERGHRGEI